MLKEGAKRVIDRFTGKYYTKHGIKEQIKNEIEQKREEKSQSIFNKSYSVTDEHEKTIINIEVLQEISELLKEHSGDRNKRYYYLYNMYIIIPTINILINKLINKLIKNKEETENQIMKQKDLYIKFQIFLDELDIFKISEEKSKFDMSDNEKFYRKKINEYVDTIKEKLVKMIGKTIAPTEVLGDDTETTETTDTERAEEGEPTDTKTKEEEPSAEEGEGEPTEEE